MVREFRFNGARLADPDPSMSAEAVKSMFAGSGYPELTNASIVGPTEQGGRQVYEFRKAVGTKG